MKILKTIVFFFALIAGIGVSMLFGFRFYDPVSAAINSFEENLQIVKVEPKNFIQAAPRCSDAGLGERCVLAEIEDDSNVIPGRTMAKLKTRLDNIQRWEQVQNVMIDYGDAQYTASIKGSHLSISFQFDSADGTPFKEVHLYDWESDGIVDYGEIYDNRQSGEIFVPMNALNGDMFQHLYREAVKVFEKEVLTD